MEVGLHIVFARLFLHIIRKLVIQRSASSVKVVYSNNFFLFYFPLSILSPSLFVCFAFFPFCYFGLVQPRTSSKPGLTPKYLFLLSGFSACHTLRSHFSSLYIQTAVLDGIEYSLLLHIKCPMSQESSSLPTVHLHMIYCAQTGLNILRLDIYVIYFVIAAGNISTTIRSCLLFSE